MRAPGPDVSRIVLGVAGGIAAYKACELLRRLTESGHEVTVVPTAAALNFVGAATWEALSGRPVHTGVFSATDQVNHVRLGREADLVFVAPATADLLARAATGRADDLLTNVLLTASCPVVMAPAMHTEMWQHPATRANVATLRERGVLVVDPAAGRLTGADSGPGRLPETAELATIAGTVLEDPAILGRGRDLAGRRVVISAGGTREPLDPVRYIGNNSSGRMGIALARAARLRGAEVTLVLAHTEEDAPSGADIERVASTADLDAAMARLAPGADIVVMAVAAADFAAREPAGAKIKKDGSGTLTLDLVETTDVLAHLGRERVGSRPVLVGFAAETPRCAEELIALGRTKLERKGADLLVVNDVGDGRIFGQPDTSISILGPDGVIAEGQGSKERCAHVVLDAAARVPAR